MVHWICGGIPHHVVAVNRSSLHGQKMPLPDNCHQVCLVLMVHEARVGMVSVLQWKTIPMQTYESIFFYRMLYCYDKVSYCTFPPTPTIPHPTWAGAGRWKSLSTRLQEGQPSMICSWPDLSLLAGVGFEIGGFTSIQYLVLQVHYAQPAASSGDIIMASIILIILLALYL